MMKINRRQLMWLGIFSGLTVLTTRHHLSQREGILAHIAKGFKTSKDDSNGIFKIEKRSSTKVSDLEKILHNFYTADTLTIDEIRDQVSIIDYGWFEILGRNRVGQLFLFPSSQPNRAYFLSAYHVFMDSKSGDYKIIANPNIVRNNQLLEYEGLLAYSIRFDICIGSCMGNFKNLKMPSFSAPAKGDVYVVPNSLNCNKEHNISRGNITKYSDSYICTNATITWGHSGSMLVNEDGKIIGVVSGADVGKEGVIYAIATPSNKIRELMEFFVHSTNK